MKNLSIRSIIAILALVVLLPVNSRAVLLADIDQDTAHNLTDAILGLQILSGLTPEIPQVIDDIDVDMDGKIGLAETVYVLQILAQIIDVTPPVNVAGPSVSDINVFSAVLSVTINETGTGHYLVQEAVAPPPSAAEVVADGGFAMTANVQATVNVSGLTAATAYIIYFVAKDVAGNTQIAVQSVAFTTEDGTLPFTGPLNDTGITWGRNTPSGNNVGCTSNIVGAQDCSQGRDATHNDDSDGHAGFSFTKLDASGNSLPANAASWTCVRDNITELVWEVKTDDGGIHDKDNLYRWGGKTALGSGYGDYYNDWDTLVDGSNNDGFCGYNDWRVPTVKELESIVDYSRTNPSIDTVYFPNTSSWSYWSASPVSEDSDVAWLVNFGQGYAHGYVRYKLEVIDEFTVYYYGFLNVRLVRSGL